jgi:acyl-CoA thioesterase-2
MKTALQELLALLDLEPIEVNLFRGLSPPDPASQRVFGGQVLAQALVAAGRTVESGIAHSLHAYFLRPGDPEAPILYQVDRTRDGKRFTTRRVKAIQHGAAIFHLEASFQRPESGPEHQAAMPEAPDPETLPTWSEFMERTARAAGRSAAWEGTSVHRRPFDSRYASAFDPWVAQPLPPRLLVWIRADGALPDLPLVHQCVLAYASDFTLIDTALLPHAVVWDDERYQIASLDHAMWFHRALRADEWLLLAHDSPAAAGARAFSTARVFTRDGRLVASVVQEGLIRPRPAPDVRS